MIHVILMYPHVLVKQLCHIIRESAKWTYLGGRVWSHCEDVGGVGEFTYNASVF